MYIFSEASQWSGILNPWIWLANYASVTGPAFCYPDRVTRPGIGGKLEVKSFTPAQRDLKKLFIFQSFVTFEILSIWYWMALNLFLMTWQWKPAIRTSHPVKNTYCISSCEKCPCKSGCNYQESVNSLKRKVLTKDRKAHFQKVSHYYFWLTTRRQHFNHPLRVDWNLGFVFCTTYTFKRAKCLHWWITFI